MYKANIPTKNSKSEKRNYWFVGYFAVQITIKYSRFREMEIQALFVSLLKCLTHKD